MSSDIVEQAEKLHSEHKFADVFQLLSEGNTNHPKNVEILWRFARAHFDMAELSIDKNQKKDYLIKGLDVAKLGTIKIRDNKF